MDNGPEVDGQRRSLKGNGKRWLDFLRKPETVRTLLFVGRVIVWLIRTFWN